MAIRIHSLVFTTILISSLLLLHLSQSATSSPTAYEVIQSYNLPQGLIPKGVTHYDLDAASGKFHGYLNGSCSFSLEGSYQLKYKPTVTGYIKENRLTDLTGVSVKVVFLWLNIVEIVRDGDELEFSVGVASANFPVDNFEECPQCGCGLDCDDDRKVGMHSSSLSSM